MELSSIASSQLNGNAASADIFTKVHNHRRFVRHVSTQQAILKRWQKTIESGLKLRRGMLSLHKFPPANYFFRLNV